MNQILVTEKLYITPELKKKKKFYRIEFFISVFLVCILFSYYIYAEYDKAKSEEGAKELLANTNIQKVVEDDTTIKDELLVVVLDNNEEDAEEIQDLVDIELEQAAAAMQIEEKVSKQGTKYTEVAIVNIPKINVHYSVLSVTTDELLKMSPCRFWGADQDKGVYDANKVGNFCIVAHNYRNSRFFSKVPTLENGDIIEITDITGKTLKYMVYDKYIVDPNDTTCTSQHTNGKREVTLITCTNDSKERYVIKATEVL